MTGAVVTRGSKTTSSSSSSTSTFMIVRRYPFFLAVLSTILVLALGEDGMPLEASNTTNNNTNTTTAIIDTTSNNGNHCLQVSPVGGCNNEVCATQVCAVRSNCCAAAAAVAAVTTSSSVSSSVPFIAENQDNATNATMAVVESPLGEWSSECVTLAKEMCNL